jgi:hypothetical protein
LKVVEGTHPLPIQRNQVTDWGDTWWTNKKEHRNKGNEKKIFFFPAKTGKGSTKNSSNSSCLSEAAYHGASVEVAGTQAHGFLLRLYAQTIEQEEAPTFETVTTGLSTYDLILAGATSCLAQQKWT